MGKNICIIEDWTRDLELPGLADGAEIYNAPRPFPCHQAWTGPFIHGVFYGAIFPDREFADGYRERAIDLDASRLVFVARATVEAWGREYCQEHGVDYGDFTFDDIVRSYLHKEENDEL